MTCTTSYPYVEPDIASAFKNDVGMDVFEFTTPIISYPSDRVDGRTALVEKTDLIQVYKALVGSIFSVSRQLGEYRIMDTLAIQ